MSAGQETLPRGERSQQRERPLVRARPTRPTFEGNNYLHANPYPEHGLPGADPASARPATRRASPSQVVVGNVPGNQGTLTEGQLKGRMSLLRRKPRGPVRRDPPEPGPDERIFGRHYRGLSPVAIGLVVAILFVVGFYLGFTKRVPFTSRGYELHATFESATTLKPNSLVRIAGVNVGKVSSVEPEGTMAEVTFNVSDDALPIHEDATIKVRPRLFLEGNFFLDLHPGSPSAPELDSGSTIPVTQTTRAVQIDEILTSLQSDTRTNLQRALEGYGKALNADAHRRPGRHPGPGRAGPHRRRGDQRDLPLRRQGGPHLGDRQPGVPGPASARPLRT